MENDEQGQPQGNNFPSQPNNGLSGNNLYGNSKLGGAAGNNFGGRSYNSPAGNVSGASMPENSGVDSGSLPGNFAGGSGAGMTDPNIPYNNSMPGGLSSATQKKLILMIVAILIIAGIGVLYLFLRETPEKVLKAAASATKNVKTYSFDGIVKLDSVTTSGSLNPSSTSVGVEFKGKMDQTDPNKVKDSANLKLSMNLATGGKGQEISLDADMVSLQKEKVYYKINSYNLGFIGLLYGGMLDQFKGNWYYTNFDELAKMGAVDASSPDVSKKAAEIYGKYSLLHFKKDLGNTTLNGISTYHYQLSLDKKALVDFYLDVLKEGRMSSLKTEKAKKDYEASIEKQREALSKPNKTIDDFVNNLNMEVWIGKSDKIMYKVFVSGNFDEKLFEELDKATSDPNSKGSSAFSLGSSSGKSETSFELSFAIADINKPVSISEPQDAKDFGKAFGEAMEQSYKKVTPPSESYNIDSDKDGLSDQVEKVYKTDPNNPDTDKDGHNDGDEVKNGFDPLNPKTGAKLKL